jgi:uncharacterized membrane protein (UPF0127 family)
MGRIKIKKPMKAWHRVIVGLGGLVLLLAIGFLGYFRMAHPPSDPATHQERALNMNGLAIQAEIVSSSADIQEGLSDRLYMAHDHAMLFDMYGKDTYVFWMQRMHFPLDIIYLDGGKVVDIATNLPAPGFFGVPAVYTPKAKADQVLEVNAGIAAQVGLRVGDTILGLY